MAPSLLFERCACRAPQQLAWWLAATIAVLLCTRTHAAPVEIIPPDFQGAMQPQVAVAPGGAIHVTFGKGSAVYHAASIDGGRTFTQATKVGELPKLALGMRRGPRIVAGPKVLAVTAISHAEGALYGWASVDGGANWKQTSVINSVKGSAREGLHAMAADENGHAFVTWLDLRNKGMELWSASSADGGLTWGTNSLVYRSPDGHICECCHPSAAMDGHGRIAVMWRNWINGSRDMYLAESSDFGKSFGVARQLGAGTWKLNGCPMDGGALVLRSGGAPITAWRREKAIFAADPALIEQKLADSGVQPVVVTTSRGDYFLWETDGNLMLKKGAAPVEKLAANASFAAAAPLAKGGAVVVWQSEAGGVKTLLAEAID